MTDSPTVRPATADDLSRFYVGDMQPKAPLPTVEAWVGELDGEVIAVGGVNHRRGWLEAFYDCSEKARQFPMDLYRASRKFMASLPKDRLVYGLHDSREPGGARWMQSLGFKPVEGREGLYRLWRD